MKFQSPHDNSEMVLTPEYSTEIQNTIGADIIMQLDDVVHSSTTGPRVEEAMWRTVREDGGREGGGRRGRGSLGGGEERDTEPCLYTVAMAGQVFTSSQETSGTKLVWHRTRRVGTRAEKNLCKGYENVNLHLVAFSVPISEMVKRDLPGYAIGGLSGGEEKDIFWRIVSICTDFLPRDKPRYCMGVG